MKNIVKILLATLLFTGFADSCDNTEPPKPYGTTPTTDQVKWQQLEYYMFIHFGPNTFTNVEWGDGKEDPKVFNPTDVDCNQWAETAKNAGMKGIIITAKHHDGFCLWPSKYSTHTVRESAWKDGKGDILKELSEACKKHNLKFGVYLSPWDQNHPAYGTPEYNQIFSNTLNEVLSSYGEVFEQWFDGANGEGHGGKKQVYDWNMFHETVYRNQPHAIIFSDVGPGCRWMGNERGVAGETNWSTMNIEGFGPGRDAPPTHILNSGEMGGQAWVPAETDVSIRPGWFYSPSTDEKVKSVEKLVDIYYTSIGRNSNLLLNVPPDRRGRIHPNDSTRLMEFRDFIEESFKNNLIGEAKIEASATRGNASKYAASKMADNDYESYWTTNDEDLTPNIEINFKEPKTLNRLLLQEYIPLGQRVSSFSVKYFNDDNQKWADLIDATTIGYKRILRFPTVTTSKLKIDFNALACPAISTISIYKAPEILSSPAIKRDKDGTVSITCESPDPTIYYTVNGEEPTLSSNRYTEPFDLYEGGTVKAIATTDNGNNKSNIISVEYDVAPKDWKVTSPSVNGTSNVIDGNDRSYAQIGKKEPLIIDLGKIFTIKGFTYMPVMNVQSPNIFRYDFYISDDVQSWKKVKTPSIFNNIKNNPIKQNVYFDTPVNSRFIKLTPTELTVPKDKYTIAELAIITK